MDIIADTHLHLYPEFDLNKALVNLFKHLTVHTDALKLGYLAEAGKHAFYDDLLSGAIALSPQYEIHPGRKERWLEIRLKSSGNSVYLLPGKQVISAENIEILVLGTRESFDTKMPARDIIRRARAGDAVPVVAWSLGKWLGSRGKVVAALIDEFEPNDFLVGDTTMRPLGWPTPVLMKKAIKKGFRVVAGSDPLPFAGEEQWLGKYRSHFSVPGLTTPDKALLEVLAGKSAQPVSEGQRATPMQLFHRQRSLGKSKKQRAASTRHHAAGGDYPHETPDIATSSNDYATRFSGDWGKYLLDVQNRLIEQALPTGENITVLELGGGHGQLLDVYARNHIKPVIFGSTPDSFGQIKPGEVETAIGDFAHLPYPDQSFDAVVAIRLVMHLDHWQDVVAEMARVAKKCVIIDYPAVASANIMTPVMFHLKKGFEKNTRDYTLFSHREILEPFEKAGFRAHSRHGQFLLPMVVHRMTKAAAPMRALESLFRVTRLTDLAGSPVILRVDRS